MNRTNALRELRDAAGTHRLCVPLALMASVMTGGCFSNHVIGEDAGSTPDDSAIVADDARIVADDASDTGVPTDAPDRPDAFFPSGPVVEPPPGLAVCGGDVCGAGELCCTATARCFAPSDPTACAVPPAEMAPGACASNLDCEPDQICEYENIFATSEGAPPICTGSIGRCVMQRGPELCGGFGAGVCGCDGRTYPDPCAASRAGVRVVRQVPCGTPVEAPGRHLCNEAAPSCPDGATCDFLRDECVFTGLTNACGIDAQCPSGQSCCGITGLCVDADCADCCRVPPEGTLLPCADDADCAVLEGGVSGGWLYCGGAGCDAPGGCMPRMTGCSGVLEPVCGCDGRSYANACWASTEPVRVAHTGMCL